MKTVYCLDTQKSKKKHMKNANKYQKAKKMLQT